jgi:DNA-binding FadR family transcriptional regulator
MDDQVLLSRPMAKPRRIHMQLAERIGLSIVRGDIQPGDTLPSEVDLCDMMKVGRSAVRDALRVLVGKGLIAALPKSGTKVRNSEHWNHLDPDVLRWQFEITGLDDYLRKLFQLRFAVEPAASAVAARTATAEDVEAIGVALSGMANAATNEAYAQADIEFHKAIYRATHNEFFWPIAHMCEFVLQESFRICAPGDHRDRSVADHGELLRTIKDHEPENAQAATLQLLRNTTNDLKAILGRDLFADGI